MSIQYHIRSVERSALNSKTSKCLMDCCNLVSVALHPVAGYRHDSGQSLPQETLIVVQSDGRLRPIAL